jgi:FkbM family methyltransferase
MIRAEALAKRVRHAPVFKEMRWLWNVVRPAYEAVLQFAYKDRLERVINGTDRILVSLKLRGDTSEIYEPEVWSRFMSSLKKGDTIVDVGAHIGFYTVAAAKRIAPDGRVYAFEPNPDTVEILRDQLRLNAVSNVTIVDAAATSREGSIAFQTTLGPMSTIAKADDEGVTTVRAVTLDGQFPAQRIDILKIDVEGFEEDVLRGSARLLQDDARRPRLVFIEVHPYAWGAVGTTSARLIALLDEAGYSLELPSGQPVNKIDFYGEVIAVARNTH